MFKGLIFDLDGVIVDTAKYHYLAWKDIAEALNIPFTLKDNELLKGVSREESFEIILGIDQRIMTKENKLLYCTRKNENYLSYIDKLEFDDCLPGVYPFIMEAKIKGYKIALGSASKNAQLILDRLGIASLFDQIVDGNHVAKAKPDPEVFIRGANQLGLKQESCLVFEDAVAGVEAAHRGEMKAVGIGSRQLLPKADMTITTFEGWTIDGIISALERDFEDVEERS